MKKISIYIKQDSLSEINAIIASEERLEELVDISLSENVKEYGYSIVISNNNIHTFPLWDSTVPPLLLLEKIAYSKDILLGIIFYLLGNNEKAFFYFKNNKYLRSCAELNSALLNGELVKSDLLRELAEQDKSNHTILHNLAIANHYGNPDISFPEIDNFYQKALTLENTTCERLSYTARQYATFLADGDLYKKAKTVLERYKDNSSLSLLARTNILAFISHLAIKLLPQPYNKSLIIQIKSDLSQCIKQLKEQGQTIDEAFALLDASHVAMIDKSYTEALSYIQKAINLFEDAEVYELAATTRLQKSDLLFTWAQEGNPQFYKPAMNACLEALDVFKREEAPAIFAEIHHKLGVIYSEMLDEEKKRSIWTAVSISSFKEALNFFNKEEYPYEYALICHNQGDAYTKYPQTIHSDNYAKALDWYKRSLEIRSADKYSNERAITLLNYIEAAWNLNIESDFDEALFEDMISKAEEVKEISTNKEFVTVADQHIKQLKELEASIRS